MVAEDAENRLRVRHLRAPDDHLARRGGAHDHHLQHRRRHRHHYAGLRDDPRPLPEWFDRRSLLLPPQWTNTLAWRHGYYETVKHVPLGPDDVLERHVFWGKRGHPVARIVYMDECDRIVEPLPGEPISFEGLASYRRIDDLMSDALGVERAPLDEQDRAELARGRRRQ